MNKSWDTQLKTATEENLDGLSGIPEQSSHQNPKDLKSSCSLPSIVLKKNQSNHDTEMDIDPRESHDPGKASRLNPTLGHILEDGKHITDTNSEESSLPLTSTDPVPAPSSPSL